MQLVIAFLVGVASSAAVALIIYRRQRREQLESEESLLCRLAEHEDLLGIAASTSLIIQRSTSRLERDVSILRRQIAERLSSKETILDRHIEDVRRLMPADGRIDERTLRDIHRMILGSDFEYAGDFRDSPVTVGGIVSAIPAPEPAKIKDELQAVLDLWNTAVSDGARRTPDEWIDLICHFHAGLVKVHPFFDGNGLIARALLAVHTGVYLGAPVVLPRSAPDYFLALQHACAGDFEDLRSYLKKKADETA